MKKTGRFLLSILPLLIMFVIQIVVAIIQLIRYMFLYGMEEGMMRCQGETGEVLMVVHFITLLIMYSWYYLAVVRKKQKLGIAEESRFTWKAAGTMVLIGAGSYFLITILLVLWSLIAPGVIQEYGEMMEDSGIASLTVASVITSVLLAPFAEELTFRGLSLEYLKETGAAFWKINVLQALFFAIAHLNLVQGLYAFLLGLLLGYVSMKYRSLWASITLHVIVNAMGIFLPHVMELTL